MTTLTRRHAAICTLTLALGLAAVVAGMVASSQPVQAQPNPAILSQQAPSSCVCAAPVPVFGGSGGPQIAHCQCGAMSCAAATATGGVTLQCGSLPVR
jgi:tellurite resistance protein TehA-like permease